MPRSKRTKSNFKYQERSIESIRKRQNQTSGNYDKPVSEEFEVFTAKEGDLSIRIMPPTFFQPNGDPPKHYGLEVFVHYSIGADNGSYVCALKNFNMPCAICAEKDRASSSGKREDADPEYLKKLTAKKRVAVWLIDRDEESKGPQIWLMPWTLDKDIANRSIKKKTGEVLALDHDVKGHDIFFTRQGQNVQTTYMGVEIDYDTTPLSEDEDVATNWLEYIMDNSLDKCLQEFDYDYIAAKLTGAATDDATSENDDTGEDDLPPRVRARRGSVDVDDDPPFESGDADVGSDDVDEPTDDDKDEEPQTRRGKAVRGKLRELNRRREAS